MFEKGYFEKGFKIVVQDSLEFIVGSLVLVLIVAFSLAFPIVLGPGLAGLFYIAMKRARGGKVEFKDCFYGFENKFGTFVLAGLVLFLVVVGLFEKVKQQILLLP